MDLDVILTWVAGLGGGMLLLQCAMRRFQPRGWTGVAVLTLLSLGLGLWSWPAAVGRISGGFWLLFCLLPAFLKGFAQRLETRGRYRLALWIARLLACLHPLDGWLRMPRMTRVLLWLSEGENHRVRALLTGERGGATAFGRFARAQLLRAEHRWEELAAWVEGGGRDALPLGDAGTVLLYMRALGELGRLDDLLASYRSLCPASDLSPLRAQMLLFPAAFCGEREVLERLLSEPLELFAGDQARFWRASALQAAGRGDAAASILGELARSGERLIREASRRRLERPLPVAAKILSPGARAIVASFAREVNELPPRYPLAPPARGAALCTCALIVLIVGAYVPQFLHGGEWPDAFTGWGLMVLPPEDAPGEWWRPFTSCFLHGGALHLMLNLIGLWYLGRYLERSWGHTFFSLVYFGAGFGAALLAPFVMSGPAEVVGASGAVMGLLGAAAIMTLRESRRFGSRALRRQAGLLLAVFALELIVDLNTPEVGTAIHVLGFVIGLGGASLAWWLRPVAKAGAQ